MEFGVVEHRYATENPNAYRLLTRDYSSHTARFDFKHGDFTASAFIGARPGDLQREGHLAREICEATGSWSYTAR